MKRQVFHVVHHKSENRWQVKLAGANFPVASIAKKDAAVDLAVSYAKAQGLSQVKVHGLDGKIQTEWTYGSDPFPPRG